MFYLFVCSRFRSQINLLLVIEGIISDTYFMTF